MKTKVEKSANCIFSQVLVVAGVVSYVTSSSASSKEMSNIRSNQMKKQPKATEMGGSGLALEQVAAKASKSKASNSEFAFFGNADCADINSNEYNGVLYLADASGPEQCDGICTSSSCLSGLRGFTYIYMRPCQFLAMLVHAMLIKVQLQLWICLVNVHMMMAYLLTVLISMVLVR